MNLRQSDFQMRRFIIPAAKPAGLGWRRSPAGIVLGLIIACLAMVSVLCARSAQNPSLPPSQINPAAQALLNQAIQALGGSAFLNARTLSSAGRIFSIADGVTQGFVQYQSAMEFPDKRRLSCGLGSKKGVTLINRDDQGWEIDRYGMIEQSQKQIERWKLANRYSLENLLRLGIHEPGTLIQKGGQDFVDNLPALIVDIIDARQVDVKLYLNSQTYLPMRIAYRLMNPQSHEWDEYADVYVDYRAIQGIQTPMHLIRYLNGERVAETFRFQVKYGETFPPGFFQPGG
ncbi:MAG TPA: hypothetical protein VKW70_01845 [Terriglobia bacterium]|nr:hypothetical protein [Terriglobia bacterium]